MSLTIYWGMTDLHETKWWQFGIKAETHNFAIPIGGPKITEILKGTLWTFGTKY